MKIPENNWHKGSTVQLVVFHSLGISGCQNLLNEKRNTGQSLLLNFDSSVNKFFKYLTMV